jgi:hypothetical protein
MRRLPEGPAPQRGAGAATGSGIGAAPLRVNLSIQASP